VSCLSEKEAESCESETCPIARITIYTAPLALPAACRHDTLASACSSTRAVYYTRGAFELEHKVTPREIAAAHDRANQDLKLFPSWPAKRAWHKRKAADD